MASKKVGTLIKEARTEAGLTQEQLKAIAKITGVTQASLLNAAKGSTSSKKTSSSKTSMQVTATEKKLVQLYRAADSDAKKAAMKALKGDDSLTEEIFESILDNVKPEKLIESLLDSVMDKK